MGGSRKTETRDKRQETRDERRETRDKRRALGDERQARGSRKGYGYRDLIVSQKGMELAKKIYNLTRESPDEDQLGLISQMPRAAVSNPLNVAEGQTRHTTREFLQFISHAEGSWAELDTQLQPELELGYIANGETVQAAALLEEIRKMLSGLRRNLSAHGG